MWLLTGTGYWNVRTLSLLVVSILSLVVPVRPLLGWLRWSRLCWSVAPVLLTLALRIIRILRAWTALGRTVALLLPRVPLLPRVLLLLGWVSLLWRWSLISVLLLAVLRVSIRVILLVHAFWRTLCAMTVLVPIIIFLACVLLWWALLRRSVGRHLPLAHHVTALADLAHQPHGCLLSLVVLCPSGWHVVLLRRRLLVHHGTLAWLHAHVWSGSIVSHWLPLTHCHLVLRGHALG